ncbi:MAG: Nif11-like leader peptide family RiPP precursor [Polyangiaceae bacterium]
MSMQAARAFHERIKSDASLARKITELGSKLTDDDMVRFAKESGFECSVDDLDALGMELASEIGESDLDQVTGGAGPADAKDINAAKIKGGISSLKISALTAKGT